MEKHLKGGKKMNNVHYIKVRIKENRRKFIEVLKNKGYVIIDHIEEQIISSILPITVNLEKKTISVMGNITVASSASMQNRLENTDEFFCNVSRDGAF